MSKVKNLTMRIFLFFVAITFISSMVSSGPYKGNVDGAVTGLVVTPREIDNSFFVHVNIMNVWKNPAGFVCNFQITNPDGLSYYGQCGTHYLEPGELTTSTTFLVLVQPLSGTYKMRASIINFGDINPNNNQMASSFEIVKH